MGKVQMNRNDHLSCGLPGLIKNMQDELQELTYGVTGEDQELSEEDESQIDGDANDGVIKAVKLQVHPQAALQRPQQQHQVPRVCWDKFLPLRSLKVLLAENDDSTRHVVSALLRNCGYEVTPVRNGLQAWKLLVDVSNHIDLVLTEVVLPYLSGIGLLCKIMSHETRQNIPVIMMSSHDSLKLVFKCLSKGAVDFLVKPIRKNELKNLWQHVWRKCHISTSGASESGIQTQKSTKLRNVEESNNTNSGRNDKDDTESMGLNAHDGSDKGSGTQSSWTKRAVEIDSPRPASPQDQLPDPLDRTRAHFIHSRHEAFSDHLLPVTASREHEGLDNKLDIVVMGNDLEIGVPRIPNLLPENPTEKMSTNIVDINKGKTTDVNAKKDTEKLEKGKPEPNNEKPNGTLRDQAGDSMGATSNITDPQKERVVPDIPNGLTIVSGVKGNALSDPREVPFFELSLTRPSDNRDIEARACDRNVLRHSKQSAFSRYVSSSAANQDSAGIVGSYCPLNSSDAAKTESKRNVQSNSNSTLPNQLSNGGSNNSDIGSTTNNIFIKPTVFNDKPVPESTVNSLHSPSSFEPVENSFMFFPQLAETATAKTISAEARSEIPQVHLQHHHYHIHHRHYHVHNMPQQKDANLDELSLETMEAASPHCRSSNVLSASQIEINRSNHSQNGSASGSNNESNSSLNARGAKMECVNGATPNGRTSNGVGIGCWVGVIKNSAHREAALNKFREKRKERCFEKKVRYQSRKKLAEERPRVRGQFVRATGST